MSSASGRERTSQIAKLNAASMHGNARASNCGRELKGAHLAQKGARCAPHADSSLAGTPLFPGDHVWLRRPRAAHKPHRAGNKAAERGIGHDVGPAGLTPTLTGSAHDEPFASSFRHGGSI